MSFADKFSNKKPVAKSDAKQKGIPEIKKKSVNPSDHLKSQVEKKSFADKIGSGSDLPVVTVRCKNKEGADCFFVIRFSSERRMNDLKAAVAAKKPDLDLADYGFIMARGFGKDPSEQEKQRMKEEYDFDFDEAFA